jgi:quercetin dioxygenase-like cupin family protein
MAFEFSVLPWGEARTLKVNAIGLEMVFRLVPEASGGALTVFETINAPGFGPLLHRHREAEVFRVLEGRYLFEVDGKRFYTETGDVVSIPGGAAHAFVNVSDRPSRQFVMMLPAFDAEGFFTGMAGVMAQGLPDRAALNAFGARWGVEFLGPPLTPDGHGEGEGSVPLLAPQS